MNSIFDLSKKRVTDSQRNSWVHLPRELGAQEKTYLSLRRQTYRGVFEVQLDELSQQESIHLGEGQARGLNSLMKRISEGELMVLRTDKSARLVVVSPEVYMAMGEEHTSKDKEIDLETVRQLSIDVACHTSMWLKMLRVGEGHRHEERFRTGFVGGDMLAPMYVLPKDHKAPHPTGVPKSRPVVAGCSAYNAGLSELLSELLEGIFKAMEGGVGVISSEDFLANLHQLNDTISSEKFHLYNPEDQSHVGGLRRTQSSW